MTQSEEILGALKCIPADLGRSDWLKVTAALKSQGAAYKSVWEEWTKTGASFKNEDLKVWDTSNFDKISIGTLFHYAKQYGYQKMSSFVIIENKAVQAFQSNQRSLNQVCKNYLINRGIPPETIPLGMS